MDRTKLVFAALLVVSLLLGILIGSDRHDSPPAPRLDMELSLIQGALLSVAHAVERTASQPETERWFEVTNGAITIWPREGEAVTLSGDRVRATYYHAGHLLVVHVFEGTSDKASRYEHFVEPLRWTRAPR